MPLVGQRAWPTGAVGAALSQPEHRGWDPVSLGEPCLKVGSTEGWWWAAKGKEVER